MRKLLIGVVLIFISCNSVLDKKYNKSSKDSDLLELSEYVSKEEFKLLKKYITVFEKEDKLLTEKTYQNILTLAKGRELKVIEKIKEEKRQKEAKALEEEKKRQAAVLKKHIEEKKKLLCNKKWKITDYGFLLEFKTSSDSQEQVDNVEYAYNILDKSYPVKGDELKKSINIKGRVTEVKGMFGKKMTKIVSFKRWKMYNIDGTFVEKYGDDKITGNWVFTNENEIRESRPSEERYTKRKERYVLKINLLEDNIFQFTEKEIDVLSNNSPVSTTITMKKM